jgi:hypothetical protein
MGREPHATRHCPNAEEDAISEWSDEPVTANDGVRRDIRAGRIPAMSDSKRHRGNKASDTETFLSAPSHPSPTWARSSRIPCASMKTLLLQVGSLGLREMEMVMELSSCA